MKKLTIGIAACALAAACALVGCSNGSQQAAPANNQTSAAPAATSAPAQPAITADIVKASILYFVIGIPTEPAAMWLSRMDMIARPSLELIRFSTITVATSRIRKPIVKLESLGVPEIPWGPLMIISPSGSIPRAIWSLMEKCRPLASRPT